MWQARLHDIIARAIEQRIIPGCVIGIVSGDKHSVLPFGHHTYENDSPEASKDSVYDVASLTKVIPTSFLALQLIDRGLLAVEDIVKSYIPELTLPKADQITIWHLLTHTLEHDFQLSACKYMAPEEILAIIFSKPLKSPPGTAFFYSNASSILLGIVIERITGQKLSERASAEMFIPLEMQNTTFQPDKKFSKVQIVPTEQDDWRGRLLQGEVHDESAFILQRIMTPGSAGLFSTAEDITHFLKMFLANGIYQGKQLISAKVIDHMITNQLASIGKFNGLGIDLFQPYYMGTYAGERTWGKTGFTGCFFVGDHEKNTAFIMLTNHVHPKRITDRNVLQNLRIQVSDLILSSTI
ncbi:MAG: serine hydrolase [Candidatus Abawacabacteria bacterium]|nr:serine hydrolase [Candidatus Abawacabacteria bacterium]